MRGFLARLHALRAPPEQWAARIVIGVVASALLATLIGYATAHAFLCDDAYISFRYARNMVEGHGLVFNRGEYVEGYTNFLWVLELALIWVVSGVPPEVSAYGLTALYTAGTVVVTLRLAATTPFEARRWTAILITLGLLAINRSFAVWSTSGLETRQLTFFLVLTVLLLRRGFHGAVTAQAEGATAAPRPREGWRYVPASLALAACELTRPEGVLFFLCAGAWLVLEMRRRSMWRWRELVGFVAPFAAVVLAHEAFRLGYYGDLLPNTFYAKSGRPWLEGGIAYFTVASLENGLPVLLPIAAAGHFARRILRDDGVHGLSLWFMAPYALYTMQRGGDHFEFRTLDAWWPLLAVAAADGVLAVARGVERWVHRREARLADAARVSVSTLLVAILIAYTGLVPFAHFVSTYELRGRDATYRLAVELSEDELPIVRALPFVEDAAPAYDAAIRYSARHLIGTRWAEHREFWRLLEEEQYGPYRPYTGELFPDDAVMAQGTVGVAPYSLGNLRVIDTLGLTDRTVARHPVARTNHERVLAHDRGPPPGYLARRGVNIQVEPAARTLEEALARAPFVLRLADSVWMPFSSSHRDWVTASFGDRLYSLTLHPRAEQNALVWDGRALRGVRALGTFDDGLDGWTVAGELQPQPARGAQGRQTPISGAVGAGLLNTHGAAGGDRATGTVTSPPFTPATGDHLVFLVGGGGGSEVGVELRVGRRSVRTWRGRSSEALSTVVVDLTPWAAQECRLVVFDRARGPWGHVLADHFILAR